MSKRQTDEHPTITAEAPNRPRRRKGGLRVPSDNVRRPSDGDIAAPQPEDPRLAMSVAYAFSADGSGMPDDGDENGAGEPGDYDAEDDDVNTQPEARLNTGEDGSASAADDIEELDEVAEEESDEDGGGAFDMNAQVTVPLARLSEEDLAAAGRDGGGEPRATTDEDSAPVAAERSVEDRANDIQQSAAARSADEDDSDESDEEDGERDGAGVGADSVDIAFDEEEPEESLASPVPIEPSPVTQAEAEQAEAAAPVEKVPRSQRFIRAATMELSVVDLEEVAPDDRSKQARGTSLPRPTPGVPSAIASLEQKLDGGQETARTAEPGDAGDSGELLNDDLLEELDDSARAAAERESVELTGEEDEVDEVEEVSEQAAAPAAPSARADASPPPPPRGSPKPQPPPAPNAARAAAAAAAAATAAAPQAVKPRRGRGKPWFEEVFDEDYLRTLPFLTPQATQAEAQFVMESLGVEPGGQILDVGCGYGRHAMELAARGYHVVGLDSSLPLLLRGADEAQRRGLTINFVHGDMRELNFDSQFDGGYCLFSTFGYFDDETNKKTAQCIARALKPGARCVFDVLNRDYLVADLPSRVWWEGDGCVVLEEVQFNYFSSRIVSNRSVVFDDGRQVEQEISVRCFSLHELGKLLHAAGFRVLEISGSMATRGRFFGAQSRDIVVVAERRAKKDDGRPDNGA